MSPRSPVTARHQAGLSLIELMIAILIGSLLIVGVMQVFSSSRTAYQLSQGIARNQENARFAIDFMLRDLRMVGHAGCVNDQSLLSNDGTLVTGGNIRPLFLTAADRDANNVDNLPFALRFDVAIQGYEAANTGSGGSVAVATTPAAGAAGGWSPALPAEIVNLAPIAGSDIVVLRYFSPEEETITGFTPGASPTITYADESAAGSSRVATGGNGLYAVGDCEGATVFQASSTPGNTGMDVSTTGLNRSGLDYVSTQDGALAYRPGQASLFRAESMVYYVRNNNEGVPALYRTRFVSTPGNAAVQATSEELVEGIENIQLLYGRDSAAAGAVPTGYINALARADQIGNPIGNAANAAAWRRVGSVQLGLLVRDGGERAASLQANNAIRALGVQFNTPNDGHYRTTYETTVALRNRLFGN